MFGDYIRSGGGSITDYEGKGLTGVISKQLIELMGGEITPSTPSGISDDPDSPGARIVVTVKVYSNERIEKTYESPWSPVVVGMFAGFLTDGDKLFNYPGAFVFCFLLPVFCLSFNAPHLQVRKYEEILSD